MKRLLTAFNMTFGMFCAIPLPKNCWDDAAAPLILPLFPLVGLMIGGLWFGCVWLLQLWGIPLMLIAAFMMLFPALLTGFIHLDGYMDTNDAVLSRRPIEDKRKILKDPHTGAFAVIALGCLFVFAFAAAFSVLDGHKNLLILIFIPPLSRCLSALGLLFGKTMPTSGYGAFFKKDTGLSQKIVLIVFTVIVLIAAFIFCGWPGLIVLGIQAAGFALSFFVAYRQLGGVSGDVSGYALTLCECIALLALAIA